MGHVFKLGTKYSEAMDVGFLDEKGEEHDCVMGCYGIGVERMLAAVLEEHHDKDGIIWPRDVAPFDCHVVVLKADQAEVSAALDELERTLADAGLTALVDDREDSAGIKFKDADLLGMPVRLTVSPRALASGGLEFRLRSTGDTRIVPIGEVASEVTRARAESQA